MARHIGDIIFPSTLQIKKQEMLDPRLGVDTKADLIKKETFPYDGDTIYMKEGMIVSVKDEKSIYMLVNLANILSSDYSGWTRVDAGAATQVTVVDNLTSISSTSALSAKQGKELKTQIEQIETKISSVYTVKGSKNTYADLPTTGNVKGDVWNVVAAYNNNPAGTNYVWTGTEWDALGGSVDLSNYFNKTEVGEAIKAEKDKLDEEDKRLAGLIQTVTGTANDAKGLAEANKSGLEAATKSIGEINLVLTGSDDDDADGIVGRLTLVETKNTNQDTRLTNLEKLVSGDDGTNEGGSTILEMVTKNSEDIGKLEKRVKANEDAITLLNNNADVEGSVDYKIKQAFTWVDL